MCCACAGSCNHIGDHFYCAAHAPGLAAMPSTINTWPTWTQLRPCDHCYCQDSPMAENHAQCCKCFDRRHRALLAQETPLVPFRAGDTIVIYHPGKLARQAADTLRENAARMFPDVRIAVLEEGMTLQVLRREDAEKETTR